jgi:class 3 adenylate cyclase
MESHGQPGKIHCSETVYEKLSNFYKFERRGAIDIKGKGKMDTYFLIGDIA